MRYFQIPGVVILSLQLIACGQASTTNGGATPPATAAQAAPVMTTTEALKEHQRAFGASDIEAMLNGYSDNAVMFAPQGPVKGKAALRPVFEKLFAEWGKPTTKFTMINESVDGEHAYMAWNAETDDNLYESGVDAFVIRDGKKVAHFFQAKITAKKR